MYTFFSPVSFSALSLIFKVCMALFSNLLNFCDDRFSSSFTMSQPPTHASYATFAWSSVLSPSFGFIIVPTRHLFGIDGIRKLLGIKKRCLVGTIKKPKLGLRTEDHAKVAYDAWVGGCDIVKDDENLSSQKFNKFEKRAIQTLKMRDKAEKLTGEKKVYIVNVTAETNEMIRRANLVEKLGGDYIMVDALTVGFSALQTLRNEDLDLVIHAHRAMHAAITKNPKHGISMKVLAKLLRAVGVDQLHAGAVVGKMSESEEDVRKNCEALKGDMFGLKKVMPVASGGLWAGSVPEILRIFGNDVVIQAGGGIHGIGTVTGARAMRQAVDAAMQKIDLKEYSKLHKELRAA